MARNNFSSFRVLGFNVRNLENVLHQDIEVDLQESYGKKRKNGGLLHILYHYQISYRFSINL